MGSNCGLPSKFLPVTRLWMLRILVHLDGYRKLINDRCIQEPGLLREVGVEVADGTALAHLGPILKALRAQLQTFESLGSKPPRTSMLVKNVAWLARSLALSGVQADIVLFLAVAHHSGPLGKLLELFGRMKTHELHAIVATATGHPLDEVAEALKHTGRLIRSSLVELDLNSKWNFESKISLLEGIPDQLALRHEDQSELFLSNFKRAEAPALGVADYPHLGEDLEILEGYLRQVLATRQKGVNVLLWGPPGTGKTQLAKALAAKVAAPLFEIAVEDRHGAIHKGEARLGAYQLAQGILGGEPWPLILFDEVEDVFKAPDVKEAGPGAGNGSGRKGWMNRLLQENAVPAFWITNARHVLDPAYLRRFDYVLEVGVPPRSVRARMLEQQLAGLAVSSQWKEAAAEHERLTPAAIERAAKVTRAVLALRPELKADLVVDRVLGNSLEACGAPRRPRTSLPSATTYRLEILNTDRDLASLCAGLKTSGAGRLCLYGPPGTGKTAFGHHLALLLDRPLLVKRASDLQSKWLGEAEQNMARMFQEAAADNAVLLLDEADTFLQDRRGAERSWEVSQVNEMLTQLESFEGIFIASTNLMDALDPASLRRFDLKVKFEYLAPAQVLTIFRDTTELLGLPPDAAAERRVGKLARLTPGDFASVLRQARLTSIPTALGVADLLAEECRLKTGGTRRVLGFQSS